MEQSSAASGRRSPPVHDRTSAPENRGQPELQIHGLNIGMFIIPLLIAAVLALFPTLANPQTIVFSPGAKPPPDATALPNAPSPQADLDYVRPTQKIEIRNYLFDSYGPYPIAGAVISAGINQLTNAPPEWNQGMAGFGRRFGSDFAIAAVGTTARYGLTQVFREDTLYYRCDCTGLMPRLRHAAISTLTARRGVDGHRVFSIPSLVAPYAGSMTAVYGWYPNRFGAKDAFRIGNYSMLAYLGENISLEFFYNGPHSLLSRMHLNDTHGSPIQGPNK